MSALTVYGGLLLQRRLALVYGIPVNHKSGIAPARGRSAGVR